MKRLLYLTTIVYVLSCNSANDNGTNKVATIDSLQKQLNESYKPGLGEFMSGIQMHHAKLWFAGINQNWPLADFEVNEIKESLEDIQKFCSDRPEVKSIGMIEPPIDSLNESIHKKDLTMFKARFTSLTQTCNSCHHATDHAFNVVTIPTAPPVMNQDFKPAN